MKKIYFLLLGFFLISSCSDSPLSRGKIAPEFKTTDVEGNNQTLNKHKGKMVMLYFWADWCPTCKKEFPETEEYYQKLKAEGLEVLAVNVKQPKEASEKFKKEFEVNFPMLLDEEGQISDLYEVNELPTNYFIDSEGKIIRKIIGWASPQQVEVILKQNKQ